MSGRGVTICVPAYRAEGFLAETLESVLAQDWPDVHVAITVDRSDDRTEAVARDLVSGRSATVVAQPRRLGWVKNSNAALGLARTPFAMLMPHDDLLAPSYVSACMAALAEQPGAILAYSDLDWADDPDEVLTERSEQGGVRERVINVFARHFNAVAVRGVFSRQRAGRHLIPGFAIGDFAADTLWVARMAAQGPIVRVPEALYRKRRMKGSAHERWHGASAADLEHMWVAHCIEMLRAVSTVHPRAAFDPDIREALRQRLRRDHVCFLGEPGLPAVLENDNGVSKALRVYAGMVARGHRYAWMTDQDQRHA